MKPQKKAVVARKATKMPTVAKKRRTFIEKTMSDVRKEKKSKKNDKMGDPKKKMDNDKKKLEKVEDRKKFDDKKKTEEKRKERSDKPDEKKKQLSKDYEKKSDKIDERKTEKDDKTNNEETNQENMDKKKLPKCEEKSKLEKQLIDNKKKIEKAEEKKKNIKFDDNIDMEDNVKSLNTTENKDAFEDKIDTLPVTKKRSKDEKKKDIKLVKSDVKTISKNSTVKDKKSERKKISEKDSASNKLSPPKTKKDTKTKQGQKKNIPRKTVLTKKPHLSVVKRLVDKKIKLVKPIKSEEISEDEDAVKKTKKKNSNIAKNKILQEKKPKLAKHMKAKLPQKHSKISAVLKKEDKLKAITEKIMARKKIELKESEEIEHKKIANKDEACQGPEVSSIKSEIEEDSDKKKEESFQQKLQDNKKAIKSGNKISSKAPKKAGKTIRVQTESNNQTSASSEDASSEESNKQTKVSEDGAKSTKQEQIGAENTVELNLKVEAMNGESASGVTSQSDSDDDFDDEYKKSKQKDAKNKDRANSPSDERARGMRLFGFWSKPKPPRVASLNALAKVHCLYENETGGVYLGGFCKSKPEREKEKPKKMKEEKEEQPRKEKEKKVECKTEDNVLKRKLRNVPGLRGKHWDMLESSSSSSSSDEDCEKEKNAEPSKKKMTKRRKKNEEVMDLKDMVVCKRMASLNATAILAASYSDEKNLCGSSSSDTSSESEVEVIKRRRQNDLDVDKKKSRQGSDPEEVIKPSKKVVIVNQDTDVTITGVYVNQTRSTHHEGFCSIAGMQYRISSTSHTQTAATAVATELHDQQKTEQPCKSYTPLGALSSMQPPGSQGNHPNMSPRRHSAFSAPQHGYYQPAGPLIQHPPPPPPTLPPVKGPPPEPTPTPPQNSEGSDDLVATSTTSGGTSSTGGGFYRTYCPQYYGTPPQYPDLCYPPTYSHPHAHPPHYYKYPPAYRRQYYGYQESGGGGGPPPGSGATGGPGVVDYQPPPPPPGEYPLPPYYGGYPPPPHPPPPPPNPAYMHSQGRPFVDPFQGCPCPMQSCPKNVDTGALIGNGKGAPVVSGPGLSLPPSALVGPPSPARGLAGLAPPHGANAWDTDRVQINTHRNLNQSQPPSVPPSHNLVGGHSRLQNQDCRSKDEKNCTEDTLRKCGCQNACTSTCKVKMETLSPTEKLSVGASCPSSKYHNFKLENNNVKCESCSMEIADGLPCVANCNVVKCESDCKCDIMKCEQCMKEGQIAILEMDKDSGIVLDDKLDGDPNVKEELDVVVIDGDENWKKPDYEPTVQETVDDKDEEEEEEEEEEITQGPVVAAIEAEAEQLKCQKVTKRKLSLDSLSDSRTKRKLSKRALSVGSSQDSSNERSSNVIAPIEPLSNKTDSVKAETNVPTTTKKKQAKKDAGPRGQKRKAEAPSANESATKKAKSGKQSASNNVMNCLKRTASDISIMETIDDVIQQSLQMTQRKDRKNKNNCERVEKKRKNVKEESLLTVKRIVKKIDQVKEQFIEKVTKAVSKSSNQSKSKADAKPKAKASQDAKVKGKSKAKILAETKTQDAKSRATQDSKARDGSKKRDTVSKTKASDVSEDPKKPAIIKKKRKSTAKKTANAKKSGCKPENSLIGNENLTLTRKTFLKPKWNNGWSWEGEPFEAKVYLTNEETAIRRCYASMSHESGDVLRPLDCVLLKSGTRKGDLPYVAKIAALWENPDDGEMMFSLLWYYRPEHTEQGRTPHDSEDEVFASRHRDANSVACIEDKCYILTFNEYCRYRKNLRRIEEGLENPGLIVPPGDQVYPRENRQPPIPVPSDMVLFCRRVYDYRGKKLVKNPG